MNGYFSNFISRFGGTDLFSSAYSSNPENSEFAEIKYITLYNAKWAKESDETVENLSKQILFFVSPNLDDPENLPEAEVSTRIGEQLNIIGLLRGSCSIAQEFGNSQRNVRVQVSGAAIIVVEIEPDFHLACLVTLPLVLAERHDAIQCQIEKLLDTAHRTFKLLNPPFEKLESVHGREEFALILKLFWEDVLTNFNDAAKVQFGPKLIGWPSRMNHQGLFRFLPAGSYRKSTVKVPDSLSADLEDYIKQFTSVPSGYFVANYSKAIPKKYGLIYARTDFHDEIQRDSLPDLFNLLEFLEYNGQLSGERMGKRNPFSDLFKLVETGAVGLDEEDIDAPEQSQFSMNPAAAIELLHPVNFTTNLVINPITTTYSGLRHLGLAVNDQWTSRFGGVAGNADLSGNSSQNQNQADETGPNSNENGHVTETDDSDDQGVFITGANGDSNITRMLVHLPTKSGDAVEVREYLLVLYMSENILQGFIYESGLEELGQKAFYEDLKWDVCEQTMGIIQECLLLSSGGIGLNTSISSLPNPLKSIILGKPDLKQEATYDDVDLDFFFIVYDTAEKSYQSSLSNLPLPDANLPKLALSFNNAIFHLHDQLTDHFVVKSAGRIFTDTSVVEHLHKFLSNKSNNWLFYSIRHKSKAIIIIRNYNTKHRKSKSVELESEHPGFLAEYASLGFLDTLGQDVKVWLDKLNRGEVEE